MVSDKVTPIPPPHDLLILLLDIYPIKIKVFVPKNISQGYTQQSYA